MTRPVGTAIEVHGGTPAISATPQKWFGRHRVVVVTTTVASYVSASGASTLIWHVFRYQLHWAATSLAVTALPAVGAGDNLLPATRAKDEAHYVLKNSVTRSFGGTDGVVTTAGIVFGLTMFARRASNFIPITQVGSIIGVGLIVDTSSFALSLSRRSRSRLASGSGGRNPGRTIT